MTDSTITKRALMAAATTLFGFSNAAVAGGGNDCRRPPPKLLESGDFDVVAADRFEPVQTALFKYGAQTLALIKDEQPLIFSSTNIQMSVRGRDDASRKIYISAPGRSRDKLTSGQYGLVLVDIFGINEARKHGFSGSSDRYIALCGVHACLATLLMINTEVQVKTAEINAHHLAMSNEDVSEIAALLRFPA